MEHYLTISEFGRLRGVNVNSLLYYEKLGILKPAHVDPDNKYRYYAPEQLSTLDLIQLCINLDIPLKEMKRYQSEGAYWQKKMLEDGRRITEEKIRRLQTNLHKIEYTLHCQEEQAAYADCQGIYRREIPARLFIVEEYDGDLEPITNFGQISNRLFEYAERRGMPTVLPTGHLYLFHGNAVRRFLFYELLSAPVADEKVIEIPGGTYSCLQVEVSSGINHLEFLRKHFGASDRRIAIATNLTRDRLEIDSRYNEIQVLDGYTRPDDGD